MSNRRTYTVGGHTFAVIIPPAMLCETDLAQYEPFQAACGASAEPLFTLELCESRDAVNLCATPVADFTDENGSIAISAAPGGDMSIQLRTPAGSECCRMALSGDYSKALAHLSGDASALHTALMLLYTFSTARHDTLLLHASAIEYRGKGYLFLGKSGTGKSTHSRRWLEGIEGARLLNDDNPVVRISGGEVHVYGSPWSGKTPCYIDRRLPLGGIVRLSQAPQNGIAQLRGVKAYAALLPSCSCLRCDPAMAAAVHRTVSAVIEKTGVYALECRPDLEAARLCCDTITATHG